jgi:hypothetical protein
MVVVYAYREFSDLAMDCNEGLACLWRTSQVIDSSAAIVVLYFAFLQQSKSGQSKSGPSSLSSRGWGSSRGWQSRLAVEVGAIEVGAIEVGAIEVGAIQSNTKLIASGQILRMFSLHLLNGQWL